MSCLWLQNSFSCVSAFLRGRMSHLSLPLTWSTLPASIVMNVVSLQDLPEETSLSSAFPFELRLLHEPTKSNFVRISQLLTQPLISTLSLKAEYWNFEYLSEVSFCKSHIISVTELRSSAAREALSVLCFKTALLWRCLQLMWLLVKQPCNYCLWERCKLLPLGKCVKATVWTHYCETVKILWNVWSLGIIIFLSLRSHQEYLENFTVECRRHGVTGIVSAPVHEQNVKEVWHGLCEHCSVFF